MRHATRFAALLTFVGVASVCAAMAMRDPIVPPHAPGSQGDAALYRAVVHRISAGEAYYDAMRAELLARHYGIRSAFNWRLPGLLWFMGHASMKVARTVLGAAIVALLILVHRVMRRECGIAAGVIAATLVACVFLPVLPGDAVYFSELWAGVAIALSVFLFADGHVTAGVAAGIGALFLRELAAPFVVVAASIALRERRWRELGAWVVGIVAFAVYLAAHMMTVHRHLAPGDPAYPSGWIQFGGLRFVIATMRGNPLLIIAPPWLIALFFATAAAGAVAWPGRTGTRVGLTLGAYAAAFSIVGKPVNEYWGLLYAPLSTVAVVWGVFATQKPRTEVISMRG